MIETERRARRTARTAAALPLLLAAAGLLAAGCGAGQSGGEEDPAESPPDTTAAATDTGPPAAADRLAAGVGTDTAAPSDSASGSSVDTPAVDTPAAAGEPAADTAARRWQSGGYLVYLRSGESPDSVAAAHGVAPDTVLADLPGFYARLTADQAGALAADGRVRELARQLRERPTPEPRGMPTGRGDTTGGR